MAMFDFGRKPSWIENPPEGTMVTTAEAPTDNPFLGFKKANMQAFTKFMEDRGYQTGAIRGLQPNREVWYDNETGTAYTLSDTSNATISGGKKLPTPTRPSAPIRERRASEDPLIDAISADGDDAIDMAGLEPPTVTRQAPAPTRESEQVQSPAPVTRPDTVRNVRNNNPGNLRTGDVETAQRYYGEDAVTGVDKGGFAQFGTKGDGINALFQQIKIDTNRGLTAGQLIDKFTPASDDPSGNKAAKINIPKFLGVSLDTPLADINPRELALAITRQEGGNEALQAFEPGIKRSSAPTFEDIERGAANAEKMARERETSMAKTPKEPPSGMRDFRKQRLIDAGAGGLLRETATGKSDDQLLEQLMTDQLEIGEKARDVPRDVSRDIQQGARDEYGSLPITSFQEDTATSLLREARKRNAGGAGAPSDAVGVDSPNNLQIDEKETLPQLLARVAGTREPIDFTAIAPNEQKLPIESSETEPTVTEPTVREDTAAGGQSVGLTDPRARAAKPTTQTVDTATEPTTDADQQSLLSRIGSLIANNPELAASGAQLLGGLISNAAQNRAQRRADRATDQRVARANLISAITGGRARPTVERAQADTGGFMSLDTLGKALQGGGAAVKGELSRRVEEAERERKAGLEQGAADLDKRAAELAENRLKLTEIADRNTENYRNRMAQIKEDELALRRDIFKAENNKQPVGEQLSDGKILEFSSRIQAVAKTDELTDFLKDANLSFLEKGQFSFKNVPQLLFGGNAAEAEARRQNLIQAMAESYGGKLSNQDVERIDKQLFTQRDNLKTSLQVAEVFRSTLVESLERDLGLLDKGGFNVGYIRDNLYETDQGQSESDADRLGSMLSDNPLDRISRQ